MIRDLDRLTMAQFIDLVSGNADVLAEGGERLDAQEIASATRDIIQQYHEIADPAGARSRLMESEEYVKARTTLQVLAICSYAIAVKEHGKVREILEAMGIECAAMTESGLGAVVKSHIGRAKAALAEIEKSRETTPGDVDVRRRFDCQAAAMMTHFKFQIDLNTMKATIYAHMVAQYHSEMKARLSAMKR